jgi:hypothetical protein
MDPGPTTAEMAQWCAVLLLKQNSSFVKLFCLRVVAK